MATQLKITLFGSASFHKGKELVEGLPSRAAEALLIYLACQQKPVTREKLGELLWADRSPTQSLTNLRTILTALRRELDDHLIITRDTLAFNTDSGAFIDIFEFEQRLKELGFPARTSSLTSTELETLRLTLDLYRGDFLDGFHLRDGLGFEEWSILERERLKRLARDGFRTFTHACLERGLYAQGLSAASNWLRLDPYDEEACRAQMWLFMRSGQRTSALQTYQTLKKKLADELSVSPATATTELYRRFQTIEVPPAIHLPSYVTEFVGREAGLVNELIQTQDEHRLHRFIASALKLDLVVLDELGFIPFSENGARVYAALATVLNTAKRNGQSAFQKLVDVMGIPVLHFLSPSA